MSGHSKWSTIRHKKAANDAVKGSVFTKMAKGITIAVKRGGGIGDPEKNFALRLAVDKARSVNMPKENIDRAIDKGMGKNGEALSELVIEAFGPGNLLVIIEVLTDSRNRSVAELRTLIEKHGGRMGEPGSVMHNFEKAGIITCHEPINDELQLEMIDLGVNDVNIEAEAVTIYSQPESMHRIIKFMKEKNIEADGVIGYRPRSVVMSNNNEKAILFLETISQYDDVQEVYANLG